MGKQEKNTDLLGRKMKVRVSDLLSDSVENQGYSMRRLTA